MSDKNSEPIQIRLLQPENDLQALLKLLEEIEIFDQFGEDVNETALRSQFKWFGHDPKLDRWVAYEHDLPDRFIYHAWTFAQTDRRSVAFIAVHPEFRRRRVGSRLLNRATARTREVGADQVVAVAQSNNAAADEFLRGHGFEPAGMNRFYTAPAGTSLPDVLWPEGYSVRALADFQDVSLYVDALNACYTDMWGLSLIHISEPTRLDARSRMPSSA